VSFVGAFTTESTEVCTEYNEAIKFQIAPGENSFPSVKSLCVLCGKNKKNASRLEALTK